MTKTTKKVLLAAAEAEKIANEKAASAEAAYAAYKSIERQATAAFREYKKLERMAKTARLAADKAAAIAQKSQAALVDEPPDDDMPTYAAALDAVRRALGVAGVGVARGE